MREFRREIALSIVGLLATVVGFAAGGPLWGFRVLGVFLLVSAAWIFAVGHGAYLIPGFKPLYLDGKAAGAVTLANAAVGLLLLAYSSALAAWTYRACTALPVMRCEPAPVCVNAGITSLTSPARSVRAVRFTRTCDSKPPTTHVSILAVGEELGNQPGNVFAVDGKADLALLWIDGKHLAISGAGRAPIYTQQTNLNGVRISYDERPR